MNQQQEVEPVGAHVVAIEGSYEGELRVRARHGPSGAEVVTDAPLDNHGRGASFSPTDLVATALGSCISTVVGIVAARRELDLTGMTFRVTKEMVSEPTRRIGRLVTTLHLPASLAEADRRVLERAAHGCPVHKSLAPQVEAPIEFVYDA